MRKRGKNPSKGSRLPKGKKIYEDVNFNDLDDEIDAFHKEREKIPLDVNDDDDGASDDDDVLPVLNYKDIDGDEDEDEEGEVEDLIRKIKRTQKFLKAKTGGVEDETQADTEDEDDDKIKLRRSRSYYGADNVGHELDSSDVDSLAEEEEEAKRLQRERAKSLSLADFGIEDAEEDDSDKEPTLGAISAKGKGTPRPVAITQTKYVEFNYDELKRDLSGLSRDDLMEVVYSSAPELVGLLGELNDALKQLEDEVNPLLVKCSLKIQKEHDKKGLHYLELKRLLLLSYCQAITFYLLLKSDGVQVRDHPVVERLVEIKSLLDKVKKLDINLPSGLAEMGNEHNDMVTATEPGEQDTTSLLDSVLEGRSNVGSLVEKHELSESEAARPVHMDSLIDCQGITEKSTLHIKEATAPVKMDVSTDRSMKLVERTHHNEHISKEGVKMLKVRAALEQKLKQKGILTSTQMQGSDTKRYRHQLHNRRLETLDDFDDDAMEVEGVGQGASDGQTVRLSKKLSQLIATMNEKPKAVSGDDDLPVRDDIGERRRKHELRVLSGAGIKPVDDEDDAPGSFGDNNPQADSKSDGSEDDMYEQVKKQRAEKLYLKAKKYSRHPTIPLEPEATVEGKRQITTKIEKNRGLTRSRRKDKKNPRKNYKTKFEKAQKRHGGQVRKVKQQSGPYGGEASGINIGTTHSIRFKG